MKAHDALTVSCLRMVLAAAQNRELEKRAELDDAEFLKLLGTVAKQRVESIEMYKKGGRTDLVQKEEAELAIIKSFMPSELSEDEVLTIIKEAIKETNAQGQKDLGKVMKVASSKIAGRADGRKVNELVRSLLS